MNFTKAERISLKRHPTLTESWVQSLIAADPSILGLGELVLRDRERIHPKAGRLDLLLQNPETKRRYEVEIQLGATDEAHIIRTNRVLGYREEALSSVRPLRGPSRGRYH